jgi:hypothetical protein
MVVVNIVWVIRDHALCIRITTIKQKNSVRVFLYVIIVENNTNLKHCSSYYNHITNHNKMNHFFIVLQVQNTTTEVY